MGASRYVGRVGGLAIALGAGVFLMYAAAEASADAAAEEGPAAGHSRLRPAHEAAARPHPRATPASATVAGAAVGTNGITVNPTTTIADGIVRGTLNASSATGQDLTYTAVGSSKGGKIDLGTVGDDPQSYTVLPYADWLDGADKGSQTFTVRVSENTAFDKLVTGVPVVGLVAAPIIDMLQQTPLVSTLLAPIIGSSVLASIDVDVAALAPGNTPLAFTYRVESFDGTLISTNFFPAVGLSAGRAAPTVMNGPGLALPGATDPYAMFEGDFVPGVAVLRESGYNVVTWDPRGEYASSGILQLDNPFYEGRDVSALITWLASETPAQLNADGDPRLGMVGGSYGGGIQMTTVDPRIDAIVPSIAWNSLNASIYPSQIFKTGWANVLALGLFGSGARINTQIYEGVLTGNLLGLITESGQAALASTGPTVLLNQLRAPVMFVQGTVDALFPLAESITNAQTVLANPYVTPVKMIWFCGGHGICLDPTDIGAQGLSIEGDTLEWLDSWVKAGTAPAEIPNFQWWDQLGGYYSSDLYPFDDGFNRPLPLVGRSDGGTLGILPFALGGSGPNTAGCAYEPACGWPFNQVFATPAPLAINVPIVPSAGDQIVGAPTVSFTYSGLGTARAVYGQIIDDATGRVLGNIATQIPVTLDGQPHTVSADLADIAYTATANPSLTLQITGSATLYWNSSFGLVDISDVRVDLPLRQTVLAGGSA